jgi:glutaredoxin
MHVSKVTIVYADWCPHCNPPGINAAKKLSKRLNVPLRMLNIDDAQQLKEADRMVTMYGDNSKDYLIPQIFLEYEEGPVQHVFTGYSESPSITQRQLDRVFSSDWYRDLKRQQAA